MRLCLLGLMLLLSAANLQGRGNEEQWKEHCFAVQRKLQEAFTKMNREQNYSVKTLDFGWWEEAVRRQYIRKLYHDPGQGPLSKSNFLCDHSELVLCRVHGQHPEARAKHICYDIQWRLSYKVQQLEAKGTRVDYLTLATIKNFNDGELMKLIAYSGGLSKHEFTVDEFGNVFCEKHWRSAYREREYRCFHQQLRIEGALQKYWRDNPNVSRELSSSVFSQLWNRGYLDVKTESMDDPGRGTDSHYHYGLNSDLEVSCRNHQRPRKRPLAKGEKKGWLLDWKKSNQ